MTRNIFWVGIALFLVFSCQPEPKTEFTPESLSQNIYTLQNEESTLGDELKKFQGKKVLIDVWASWCGDCVKSLSKVREFQKQHPDVEYVFLSVDDDEMRWRNGIEKFMGDHNMQGEQFFFKTGWDKVNNEFIKFAKLDWIPRYMLVGEDGKILEYYSKDIEDISLD